MTNIPFPNPHDADALNEYLDDLAAGKQANPESDVEMAAQEFHHLASRAEVNPETRPNEQSRGEENMHTATLAAPVSNRTRRQMTAEKPPTKSYGWLSAVIVAGLMISLIGAAWLNREPGNPNENLAWAPGTAEPFVEDGIPWTQPISFAECPDDAERNTYDPDNAGGTHYSQEDYEQASSERSYEIVGPTDPEDANAIVTRTRESAGCSPQGKQATLLSTDRHTYETRTTAGRESLDAQLDQREEASGRVSEWFATELGVTPESLYVHQNPDELTVDQSTSLRTQPLYNPELAVEFADGRIGVLRVFVTYEGFSDEEMEIFESTEGVGVNMTIFAYQGDEWMTDEVLPICIGDCSELPVAKPITSEQPIATPEPSPTPEPTPTTVPRGGDNRG